MFVARDRSRSYLRRWRETSIHRSERKSRVARARLSSDNPDSRCRKTTEKKKKKRKIAIGGLRARRANSRFQVRVRSHGGFWETRRCRDNFSSGVPLETCLEPPLIIAMCIPRLSCDYPLWEIADILIKTGQNTPRAALEQLAPMGACRSRSTAKYRGSFFGISEKATTGWQLLFREK